MRLIMGIDPGSRVTGWGIIKNQGDQSTLVDFGTIRLGDANLGERLLILAQSLNQIMHQYRPHEVVVEKIFLGKNADSAFKLGHARGVGLLCASQNQSQIFEYAAKKVKQSLTGSGNATKEQVQTLVKALLKIKSTIPLDASDALSLALCHATEKNLQIKINKGFKGVTL